MEEIKVSIVCMTFNHEKYIEKAIESFLSQKTNFKYEILIHDDASTDKTASIISKYVQENPKVIKAIFQKENQYSQGVKITADILYPMVSGKYIAFCEGDDYWIDSNKLQYQVDYMDDNDDCSVCVHAAYVVDVNLNKTISEVRPAKCDLDFSFEEVLIGGGGLFATSSMFFRSNFVKKLPEFYYSCSVGDYPKLIYLALKGRVHYIDKYLSVYQIGIRDSWTTKNLSSNFFLTHYIKRNEWLDEINKYTEGKYIVEIEYTKLRNEFKMLLFQKKYSELKEGKYRKIFQTLSLKEKIKIFVNRYSPFFIKILRKFKRNKKL